MTQYNLTPISESNNFESNITVEGFVKAISKKTSIWIDEIENYRDVCNARLVDMNGNYINIGFWEADTLKVRNNLKIRIIDAKWNTTKHFLCKSKTGSIVVLSFNPNHIGDDILRIKKKEKITSFKQYHQYVSKNISTNYLGMEKNEYLRIAKALLIIEKFKNYQEHRLVASAIRYLFRKIELNQKQIRDILRIFNVIIPHKRITISIREKPRSNIFNDDELLKISQKRSKSQDNKYSNGFWTGLPDEISIVESSDN